MQAVCVLTLQKKNKKKEFDLKLKLYVCILKTSVQIYLGHKNIKIFFDCL